MMSEWSHLPNAKYIDLILADLKKNPDDWFHAYTVVKGDDYNAAWKAAKKAASEAAWDAASEAAWDAAKKAASEAAYEVTHLGDDYNVAKHAAYYAARYAILALIAYDDCSWILNEKPEDIKLLAVLTQELAYVLLYPAVLVLLKQKDLDIKSIVV
jgi:predicted nucleotidyltransferase